MNILIKNLTVSYQRRPVVHHLDMEFGDKEMWAIFGPNGAGKSTLLKALMRLLPINTGEVIWHGLSRKDFAYLPQQNDIDRSQPMTVFDLAAMGLWYEIGFFKTVTAQQRQRVHQALARVQMEEFADRQISHLSNGQFQRVLFARMLIQGARVFLLDEPFNAVDAKTTLALLELLKHCHQRGQTVITVLHDYEQVCAYFDQTLLIAREKIAAGPTKKVLTAELLLKANEAMQQDEKAEWCVA